MDFSEIIVAGKVSEIDMTNLSLDNINTLIRQLTEHNNMVEQQKIEDYHKKFPLLIEAYHKKYPFLNFND